LPSCSFLSPSFVPRRERNRPLEMRRRYVAFEAVFAICSAISPVQERLGVHHAASGSAATNPEGTIKLHLNKASSRDQGGKGKEGEGGTMEGESGGGGRKAKKRGEIRAASLQKKAAGSGMG